MQLISSGELWSRNLSFPLPDRDPRLTNERSTLHFPRYAFQYLGGGRSAVNILELKKRGWELNSTDMFSCILIDRALTKDGKKAKRKSKKRKIPTNMNLSAIRAGYCINSWHDSATLP
jgi:hypothetical protein